MPRHVIFQPHSNKYRAIDNGRASGHNSATITSEKVRTTSLEWFAYRKYATSDGQAAFSVAALFHKNQGRLAFLPLVGHAFGLKAL